MSTLFSCYYFFYLNHILWLLVLLSAGQADTLSLYQKDIVDQD